MTFQVHKNHDDQNLMGTLFFLHNHDWSPHLVITSRESLSTMYTVVQSSESNENWGSQLESIHWRAYSLGWNSEFVIGCAVHCIFCLSIWLYIVHGMHNYNVYFTQYLWSCTYCSAIILAILISLLQPTKCMSNLYDTTHTAHFGWSVLWVSPFM